MTFRKIYMKVCVTKKKGNETDRDEKMGSLP